jgi:hypothetical protein
VAITCTSLVESSLRRDFPEGPVPPITMIFLCMRRIRNLMERLDIKHSFIW